MVIKAIIFDFFGVVGQSTYQLIAENHQLTKEKYQQLSDLHKAFDNGFIGEAEFLQDYAKILEMNLEDFIKQYYESEDRFTNSYKVLAYVEELKKEYKVALLSNVGLDGYQKFIEPIDYHFDLVVTSYQTGLAKPERAIFEHVANELGIDVSECVMIDDSPVNCQGAEYAGMNSILFTDINNLKAQLTKVLSS